MSNRRKLLEEVPAGVAAMVKTARCSDCRARGQARCRGGEWEIRLLHQPSCPAFALTTPGLHKDAEQSVKRAAERTGTELVYEVLSDSRGVVTGSGLVSASGGR